MTNKEALKALSDGKCVRHVGWVRGAHLRPDFRLVSTGPWAGSAWGYLSHYKDGWEIYAPSAAGLTDEQKDALIEIMVRHLKSRRANTMEDYRKCGHRGLSDALAGGRLVEMYEAWYNVTGKEIEMLT